MALFRYKGRNSKGEIVNGKLEARSQEDAILTLRSSIETVLAIKEVKGNPLESLFHTKGKVSPKAISLMCQQFSIILKSGLPLMRSVVLVSERCKDRTLQNILKQVAEDVAGGMSLSYSLAQRGSVLPMTLIETIKAGEESGDLSTTFDRLGKYYDKSAKTNAKVVSTLMYPAFLIVTAIGVIAIIMIYAVPAFMQAFGELGATLPGPTKILIAISNFFQKGWPFMIAVGLLLVTGFQWYKRSDEGKMQLAKTMLGMPLFGDIARMGAASQFAHTMSTMLAAGMPIIKCIDIAAKTVTNNAVSTEIKTALEAVEAGSSLGVALEKNALEIPGMLTEMIAIGEASGSLEYTLGVLAEYYDNEVDTTVSRTMSTLEPIIILIMAGLVFFILLAVYMPMFSMYDSI